MLAVVLQVLGLVAVVVGGFLVSVATGVIALGVVAVFVGLAFEAPVRGDVDAGS